MSYRHTAFAIIASASLLVVVAPSASAARSDDGSSLSELQARRSEVRSSKAAKASKVNALKATDAEVAGALNALSAQVSAQQDKVEEAERVLGKAEEDRAAAEAAQAQAQAQLDQLRNDIKASAVEAYVNIGSADPTASAASADMNEAVNKRVLLDSRATRSQDLVEKFRATQEDLELQRQAKAEAEERATTQRKAVKDHKAELDASYAKQQKFSDEVDARLDAALSEAAALANLDAGLSQQITSKQAAIAKAQAAQRAAQEARAAKLAASQKAAGGATGSSGSSSSAGSNSSGGGGNFTPPKITGSGSIVSVSGIRVHQSIAGNLASLLSAAAADGIHLSGGGYRDPSGQIAVRKNNCGTSNYAIYQMSASSCRPPTARPGTSMHEQGLAIDFTQGGRTLTRGSSGFQWMRANAGRFGFQNLPSEPWHWSTNGR